MEKIYFIETKEQYLSICVSWKKFVNEDGTVNSSHMMLYNVFRSRPFDYGFTPMTKQIKLDNGRKKWECLNEAAGRIQRASIYGSGLTDLLKSFGETIGKGEIDRAWALIKEDPRLK
jgi:hypothetical protein